MNRGIGLMYQNKLQTIAINNRSKKEWLVCACRYAPLLHNKTPLLSAFYGRHYMYQG